MLSPIRVPGVYWSVSTSYVECYQGISQENRKESTQRFGGVFQHWLRGLVVEDKRRKSCSLWGDCWREEWRRSWDFRWFERLLRLMKRLLIPRGILGLPTINDAIKPRIVPKMQSTMFARLIRWPCAWGDPAVCMLFSRWKATTPAI